jgi:hypothetical protein
MLKRGFTVFLLGVLFLLCSAISSHAWLIYHKPEFKGKVIDADTKEPIEGAVVVAEYSKQAIRIAPESVGITINVKETLTDKDGNFLIPSYTTIIDPFAWSKEVNFIIFKPSYGSFPDWRIRPPKGMDIKITWDEFFSGQIGVEKEVQVWVDPWRSSESKKEKVAFGIVELPKLKTWEERKKADMLSPTDDENEWPLLHKMIKDEDDWLWNNKNWRK